MGLGGPRAGLVASCAIPPHHPRQDNGHFQTSATPGTLRGPAGGAKSQTRAHSTLSIQHKGSARFLLPLHSLPQDPQPCFMAPTGHRVSVSQASLVLRKGPPWSPPPALAFSARLGTGAPGRGSCPGTALQGEKQLQNDARRRVAPRP